MLRTPLKVFTGMQPMRPLLRALPMAEYRECPTLSEIRARQVMRTADLQAALDNMHRDVGDRVKSRRCRAVDEHSRRNGVQPVNFSHGYFVLVRKAVDRGHKLNYKWIGPRRVLSEISRWSSRLKTWPKARSSARTRKALPSTVQIWTKGSLVTDF